MMFVFIINIMELIKGLRFWEKFGPGKFYKYHQGLTLSRKERGRQG
jgi:hypothetical protein